MKEIIILVLSISLVSVFAGTANAMRSFLQSSDKVDTQEATASGERESSLPPIVFDQPPEDEEDWPGHRE